jgi:predicted nucleotidyltransferase
MTDLKMNDIAENLKKYFSGRNDIVFAFLYGSQAKGRANRLSDVDVAVYFYPRERRPIECEQEVFYDAENEIWGDLEKLLKKEVELLVLNRAPATVAASALRGLAIVINDWDIYLDFMLVATDIAEDFTELVINDYQQRNNIGKRV